MPNRTFGETVVAMLALAQSVFGILRALNWLKVDSNLLGQGLFLLPLIGMVAYARGFVVALIAFLYAAFAWGIFTRRGWACSLGIAVSVVNLLLVLSVLTQGEAVLKALFWIIVPLIILWYLISQAGRLTAGPKA
jgi:hypothetical protein